MKYLALALLVFAAGFARYGEGFALGVGLGVAVAAGAAFRAGQYARGYGHARGIRRSHWQAIGGRR